MQNDVATTANRKCTQPGCTFDNDGTCLEGLANAAECPHISFKEPAGTSEAQEAPEPESAEEADEETIGEDWPILANGEELVLSMARAITAEHDARVIVIAGEPEAGKTTLISCLFEQFSAGPYVSRRFSGSETIIALEEICYLSRTSSEAERADTDRTKGLHLRFLHLELQNLNAPAEYTHLLLTDVSGEAYRRAIDNSEDTKRLSFIRRADRFILLIDGKRLASKVDRQDAFRRGQLILRALTEAGILGAKSYVRVVISKIDLLQPGNVDENTLEFVQYVKSEFAQAASLYRNFAISEIASRPEPGSNLPYGFGVEQLAEEWLAESVILPSSILPPPQGIPVQGREADLFLWRHFKL